MTYASSTERPLARSASPRASAGGASATLWWASVTNVVSSYRSACPMVPLASAACAVLVLKPPATTVAASAPPAALTHAVTSRPTGSAAPAQGGALTSMKAVRASPRAPSEMAAPSWRATKRLSAAVAVMSRAVRSGELRRGEARVDDVLEYQRALDGPRAGEHLADIGHGLARDDRLVRLDAVLQDLAQQAWIDALEVLLRDLDRLLEVLRVLQEALRLDHGFDHATRHIRVRVQIILPGHHAVVGVVAEHARPLALADVEHRLGDLEPVHRLRLDGLEAQKPLDVALL